MRAELEKKLFKKYPKIFKQKDLPMTETCMCWGINTGDGWFWLIDLLCSQLQWDTDHNGYPQVEATQVKEKFGTLRFYHTLLDRKDDKYSMMRAGFQEGKIEFAEYLSEYICEKCGSTKDVSQTKGWIVTLCGECKSEYKKKGKLRR